MATILYDNKGVVFNNYDLQNKLAWCKKGESMEHGFVREYGETIKYAINPEKSTNAFVPDLISTESQKLADLKTQHSPFFQAKVRYNIDPTFAVVFNVKDRERYENKYPDIDTLYFVDWIPVKAEIGGRIYEAQPHFGIYKASFSDLLTLLEKSQIHQYQQRVNDTKGNAKDSYIFDIRNEIFKRIM